MCDLIIFILYIYKKEITIIYRVVWDSLVYYILVLYHDLRTNIHYTKMVCVSMHPRICILQGLLFVCEDSVNIQTL